MIGVLKLTVNIITNTFIHNESIVANDSKPSRIKKKKKKKKLINRDEIFLKSNSQSKQSYYLLNKYLKLKM